MSTDSPDALLRSLDLAPGLWQAEFPSGLKLLIRQDHRSPVAVCNVWVRVGSNREPDAMRGWSHGIEHMLFKGTERREEGAFAREVADAGGATNAGTGYETTNYHITVPADQLEVAVDILGDTLFNANFDAESLDAERQVLVHENHMYDDQPSGYGVTWRWGMETALDVSPYRHPIGGLDANLRERNRDDILAFWRSAYRPDNMTVVIVGNVDPNRALQLVRDHFPTAADAGPTPVTDPRVAMVAAPPVEPVHDGARCRVEYGEIAKAYAKLILPAPGEKNPWRDVLPVVRRILGDGRSCRLYTRVQEERQLVDDIDASAETGPREGVMIIELETDAPRLAEALVATAGVLAELKGGDATGDECDRAAHRVLGAHLFGTESVQGQATTLGYHDSLDDLAGAFDLPQRIAAVTPADVTALSRELFRTSCLTAMIYLPQGTNPADHGIPVTGEDLAELLGPVLGADEDTGPPPTRPPRPAVIHRAAPGADADPGFHCERLNCGVEVVWRRDPAVPVVAMTIVATGGAVDESAADCGRTTLLQQVLVKGARGLSAQELHGTLESDGASLSPRAERDHVGLVLVGLADRFDRPLALAADVLITPDLAPAEIDRERRLALAHLEAVQDDPFQAAALRLRALLYGDHPYGRPVMGTPEGLGNADQDALRRRHAGIWTRRNARVVVSGDIDPDRFLPRLDELLSGLPAGQETPSPTPGAVPSSGEQLQERMVRDQKQSVVLLGWPGAHDVQDNRAPLLLLRQALNGQSGRLFESLRNRRSLCYNTGIVGTAGFGQGMILGYVLTSPETADEARDALREELLKTADAPLTEDEFNRARVKLLGNLLIGDQSNGARVGRAARDRIYGRPAAGLAPLVAEVEACTRDQVQAAAATYLTACAPMEVMLGPATT